MKCDFFHHKSILIFKLDTQITVDISNGKNIRLVYRVLSVHRPFQIQLQIPDLQSDH